MAGEVISILHEPTIERVELTLREYKQLCIALRDENERLEAENKRLGGENELLHERALAMGQRIKQLDRELAQMKAGVTRKIRWFW